MFSKIDKLSNACLLKFCFNHLVLNLFAPLILISSPLASAQVQDNQKEYLSARDQLRLRNYDDALAILAGILDNGGASIGDKTITEARRLYVDIVKVMADNLYRNGEVSEAVDLLILKSKLPALLDQGNILKERASEVLKTAFEASIKKDDSSRILELTDRFPDVCKIDKNVLLLHQIKVLPLMSPSISHAHLLALKKEGGIANQFRLVGFSEFSIVLRYAKALKQRGWYREAASLLRDQIKFETLTLEERLQAEELEEQCLLSYSTACIRFGNLKMCREALDFYSVGNRKRMKPKQFANLVRVIQKLAEAGEPVELKSSGRYFVGKGVWRDSGNGFFITSLVQTGNCANSRGGKWETAEIEVAAGTEVEGGLIRASHGKIHFKGTIKQPVILKNVKLECDYTAQVFATHTVFINCSFKKSGSWHWNNGFSSKWHFTDCILVSSNFSSLSRGDYGLRLSGSTFLRCKLPQRMLSSDEAKDANGEYHGSWNVIEECAFVECSLPPSLVWGTKTCAFIRCKTPDSSVFKSSKNLIASMLSLPNSFVDDLKASTKIEGPGKVDYLSSKQRVKALKIDYWQFIPELERE